MRYQIIRLRNRNGERQQQYYDIHTNEWKWAVGRSDGAFEAEYSKAKEITNKLQNNYRKVNHTTRPILESIS